MAFNNGAQELREIYAGKESKSASRTGDRELSKDYDRDELQRLGKKQVLRVCAQSKWCPLSKLPYS